MHLIDYIQYSFQLEIYEDWKSETVSSQLTLYDLSIEDSGTYACHAPHAATQTIPVTVVHPGTGGGIESKIIYS